MQLQCSLSFSLVKKRDNMLKHTTGSIDYIVFFVLDTIRQFRVIQEKCSGKVEIAQLDKNKISEARSSHR